MVPLFGSTQNGYLSNHKVVLAIDNEMVRLRGVIFQHGTANLVYRAKQWYIRLRRGWC